MIYEGSRYEFEKVVQVQDHTGAFHPAIYISPGVDAGAFYYDIGVMAEGTRLDAIAARVYNDPEKWWVLARANPEVFYPDNLAMGTILRIPYAR